MKKKIIIMLAVVVIAGICAGAGIYMLQNSRTAEGERGYSFAVNEEYQQMYHDKMSDKELEELLEKIETEKNAEGIFTVASQIFAKDTKDWADTDARFIAYTWDYAIQNKEADLMEAYVEGLLADGYAQQEGDAFLYQGEGEARQWGAQIIVSWSAQRMRLVMDELDPDTQGEAYYTLSRLSNPQISSIEMQDNWQDIYGADACTLEANVTAEPVCIEISNNHGKNVFITICDMQDIIDQDVEKGLINWGYDAQEVERLRRNALNDIDVSFAESFFAGEYKNAFSVNPEGMSAEMKEEIAAFMLKLEDLEGNLMTDIISPAETELEEILNTLLYADKDCCPQMDTCYHDKYLNLLAEEMNELTRRSVADIFLVQAAGCSKKELDELRLKSKEYHSQYTLWEGFCYLEDISIDDKTFDKFKEEHRKGEAYIEISGLRGGLGRTADKDGVGGYYFTMEIKGSEKSDSYDVLFHNSADEAIDDFSKEHPFENYEELNCKGMEIDVPAERIEDVFNFLREIGKSEEREQQDGHSSPFGKYSEILIVQGDKYIQKTIGYQPVAPDAAVKLYRTEKDGLRAYFEDVSTEEALEALGMSREEWEQKISELLLEASAYSEGWKELAYGKGADHVFQNGYLDSETNEFVACEEGSILISDPYATIIKVNELIVEIVFSQ